MRTELWGLRDKATHEPVYTYWTAFEEHRALFPQEKMAKAACRNPRNSNMEPFRITGDPIRAAGGCRCGECQRWQRFGEPLPDGTPADWGTCTRFLDPDSECEITTADGDFCSYGEPREAQEDG